MEILGVGLPEMVFIVLIALILLGPKEMLEASRTIGKTLRKFITSPTWQAIRTTGQELQQLPAKMMREAGLEELEQMGKEVQDVKKEMQEATRIDPRAVSVKLPDVTVPSPAAPQQVSTPPAEAPAHATDVPSETPQA